MRCVIFSKKVTQTQGYFLGSHRMDDHNCLEVLVVREKSSMISEMTEKLISTKGVKHGKLTMTTIW